MTRNVHFYGKNLSFLGQEVVNFYDKKYSYLLQEIDISMARNFHFYDKYSSLL